MSADGRVGTITWDFDVESVADVEPSTIEALDDTMAQARTRGLTVEANAPAPPANPSSAGSPSCSASQSPSSWPSRCFLQSSAC